VPGISKEDRELADAARKKAGSVTALARHFEVRVQTASGWGRRLPIPRARRAAFAAYVNGAPPPLPEPEPTPDPLARLKAHPDLFGHLQRQTEYLAQIPALREEIEGLRAQIAELEVQLADEDEAALIARVIAHVRDRDGAKEAVRLERAIAAARGRGKTG
jgi:hypothetical protein